MKYPVRRFTSLEVGLKEIEPFVRNGAHLQTGKAFKQLGDMRSREILANLLLCITIKEVEGKDRFRATRLAATGSLWGSKQVKRGRPNMS